MLSFKKFLCEAKKSDNTSILKNAIRNRNVVYFYYEGDKNISPGYRQVEPVALGYSKANNLVLRAFQLRENPSYSQHKPMWRLFRVDKISDISKSLRKFNTSRKGYNRTGDKSMNSMIINAKFK